MTNVKYKIEEYIGKYYDVQDANKNRIIKTYMCSKKVEK